MVVIYVVFYYYLGCCTMIAEYLIDYTVFCCVVLNALIFYQRISYYKIIIDIIVLDNLYPTFQGVEVVGVEILGIWVFESCWV